MSGLHILWFRQDLRVHDHAPLKAARLAAARDGGQVLPLFVFEPDTPQSAFLVDSLKELDHALEQRGAALHYRTGDALEVLSDLHRDHKILSLYVHETTRPLAEDQRIEAWCMRAGIALRAFPQYGPDPRAGEGVAAGAAWDEFMASPRQEAPADLMVEQVGIGQRPIASAEVGEVDSSVPGGRKAAITALKHMLGRVSELQQLAIAPGSISYFDQLYPYLEAGLISIRETWQAAVTARNQYIKAGQDIRAARVTELIRQLPHFYRERHGHPAQRRRVETDGRKRAKGSGSAQMSLDFDQTGT